MIRRTACSPAATRTFQLAAVTSRTPADKAEFASFKPDFKKYKLVVSNYNGAEWPKETQAAFEEFVRGGAVRRGMTGTDLFTAIVGLVGRNKRRYGGYVVHVGVVAIFLGVTMSSVYRVEEIHTVKQGEQFTVGPYTLRFDDARGGGADRGAHFLD